MLDHLTVKVGRERTGTQLCFVCRSPIKGDGIEYKGEPVHAECAPSIVDQ